MPRRRPLTDAEARDIMDQAFDTLAAKYPPHVREIAKNRDAMTAAQIFKAAKIVRENMARRREIDEVARMSGNDTAARMFD